jgi:hypothetical protein
MVPHRKSKAKVKRQRAKPRARGTARRRTPARKQTTAITREQVEAGDAYPLMLDDKGEAERPPPGT